MSFIAYRSITLLLFASSFAVILGCGHSDPSRQTLTLQTLCDSQLEQDRNRKIIGGRMCFSPNGTVVKLLLFDEEENQTICSGIRLDSTTVLTAAHCLNEFVFSVIVELASGERLAPTSISLHPNATNLGTLFINDVALLTISPPEDEVPPPFVPIATHVATGDTLTILGYGATNGTNLRGSGLLRIGEMQVNEVTTDLIFSDYTPPTLSNTCFGDSGGPAFVEEEDGGFALAGITSTGTNITCGVGDRSAFANLTNNNLRAFIEETK